MSDMLNADAPVRDDDLAVADGQTPARKALAYKLTGAARADVTGGGFTSKARGARNDDPYFVHQEGRTQVAMRAQAVAALVKGAVVTPGEVVALWTRGLQAGLIDGADLALALSALPADVIALVEFDDDDDDATTESPAS